MNDLSHFWKAENLKLETVAQLTLLSRYNLFVHEKWTDLSLLRRNCQQDTLNSEFSLTCKRPRSSFHKFWGKKIARPRNWGTGNWNTECSHSCRNRNFCEQNCLNNKSPPHPRGSKEVHSLIKTDKTEALSFSLSTKRRNVTIAMNRILNRSQYTLVESVHHVEIISANSWI